MKERPILFKGEMVRALLDGRKTQTRRLLKGQPSSKAAGLYADRYNKSERWAWWLPDNRMTEPSTFTCPYGQPGDRLWVKETWAAVYDCPQLPCCEDGEGTHRRLVYRATDEGGVSGFCRSFDDEREAIWKPSIFMGRKSSRLTLEITDVRVERLQDISEEDAKAEGCPGFDSEPADQGGTIYAMNGRSSAPSSRAHYMHLWESINGAGSWGANPWVWVVDFKRIEAKRVAA